MLIATTCFAEAKTKNGITTAPYNKYINISYDKFSKSYKVEYTCDFPDNKNHTDISMICSRTYKMSDYKKYKKIYNPTLALPITFDSTLNVSFMSSSRTFHVIDNDHVKYLLDGIDIKNNTAGFYFHKFGVTPGGNYYSYIATSFYNPKDNFYLAYTMPGKALSLRFVFEGAESRVITITPEMKLQIQKVIALNLIPYLERDLANETK